MVTISPARNVRSPMLRSGQPALYTLRMRIFARVHHDRSARCPGRAGPYRMRPGRRFQPHRDTVNPKYRQTLTSLAT